MNPTNQTNSQGPDERRSCNERFELLSAYMDGEVTADERRLVESWLATEPKVQQMHQRLLMLRHGFEGLPTPEPTRPVEVTIDKVFEKVERRSRFRVIIGGAAAAAAAVVATVVGIGVIANGPGPQMADKPSDKPVARVVPSPKQENMTAGLLVSLDEPVVVISKTAKGGKAAKATWSDAR